MWLSESSVQTELIKVPSVPLAALPHRASVGPCKTWGKGECLSELYSTANHATVLAVLGQFCSVTGYLGRQFDFVYRPTVGEWG